MTRIDFYVLGDKESLMDRMQFACRLTEKAVKQGNRVLIATADGSASEAVDELLWSFSPESFVPHAILGSADAASAPVVISHDSDDESHHDVMVNLGFGLPDYFSRFKRVTEIVVQEKNVLTATRKNYSWYNERGYPLNTHKL
jgi:DNA polymerase-3 subunit chi